MAPNEAQRRDIRRAFLCLAVAHEVRQPLNSINLNTDLTEKRLRKQALSDDVLQPLTVVLRAVERMSDIVDAWLDKVAPEPVPDAAIDISPIVAAAVKRAAASAKERGVAVVLAPGAPPRPVRAHRLQLAVALDAVLENAVLAAPSRSEVSVTVMEDGDQLRITVIDRGPGMSAEVARHAVEIGYSTRGADGVGLTVAKFVAYHHGGGFQIHTRPGEGTTATISLPLD